MVVVGGGCWWVVGGGGWWWWVVGGGGHPMQPSSGLHRLPSFKTQQPGSNSSPVRMGLRGLRPRPRRHGHPWEKSEAWGRPITALPLQRQRMGEQAGPEGQVLGLGGGTRDYNILSNDLISIYYFYTRHRST